MDNKIIKFAESMQIEIDNNSHKGDWETFVDKFSIMSEFYHHLNKLESTLRKDDDPELLKEYIADCSNILMMLGNSYKLYDNE